MRNKPGGKGGAAAARAKPAGPGAGNGEVTCARTPHQLAPGSRTCEVRPSAAPPTPNQPGPAREAVSSSARTRRKNLEGLTSTSDLVGEKASPVKGLTGPVKRRRNPESGSWLQWSSNDLPRP
ncbi:hypothetical protein mRhiFer1_010162 [Rhinolophus ferrumequinum]|uniref:Uncharacterized protein n=1 Tax=Rhinolophus ferrumequinum TaxID=59479 RepID=A0A7J7XQ35_RHIFE|nr:hypothetical protein mRhiFer1_010162 [Rhinolophus ferrumequinum]